MRWTIDARCGYAIIRIEFLQLDKMGNKQLVCETDASYVEVDSFWWPRVVETTCEGAGYRQRFEVFEIEFDRPEHPSAINIDQLGMPPGTPIIAPKLFPGQAAYYVGDDRIVDEDEWNRIRDAFDKSQFEKWLGIQSAKGTGAYPAWWDDASGRFGIEGVEHKPDEWEAYVRRWILKRSNGEAYKLAEPLTEKQKTAAWAVLADCKKRAHPIVEKRAAELAEARKRLGENRKVIEDLRVQTGAKGESSGAKAKQASGEDERLTQAMQASHRLLAAATELEKPDSRLAEIFEELKRRLDGLLTSVQRSDANVLPPSAVKPQSMRDGRPAPLPQRDPRQAPQAAPRLPTPARP